MGIDKQDMQNVMYKVMSELSKSKYQIVFKGSLLLSVLMEDAEILSPSRLSRDFDGDLQEKITLEKAKELLQQALDKSGVDYCELHVDKRTTEEQFFFDVKDAEEKTMFSIDLGLKVNPWHKTYKLKDGTIIYGQTIPKIFWDKICVVSTDKVEVRPHDIFDMYLLSLRNDLRMSEILKVRDETGRTLGDFRSFLYPSDDMKFIWKKRRYIKDRPEFNVMFARVRDLCTPFLTEWEGYAEWKPKAGLWYEGEIL